MSFRFLFLRLALRNLALKKGPGKFCFIFENEEFTIWVRVPDWSENLGMKGIGGGSSFFLLRPCGALVLSLLIHDCSRSILNNNSFIGISLSFDFLGTISTGVIVREVRPPQILLLKCSETGVAFLVLMSDRYCTRRLCVDVLL